MLHHMKLFEKLDKDSLPIIADLIEVVEYRTKQVLFQERSPREAVLIIKSGEVTVTHGIGRI